MPATATTATAREAAHLGKGERVSQQALQQAQCNHRGALSCAPLLLSLYLQLCLQLPGPAQSQTVVKNKMHCGDNWGLNGCTNGGCRVTDMVWVQGQKNCRESEPGCGKAISITCAAVANNLKSWIAGTNFYCPQQQWLGSDDCPGDVAKLNAAVGSTDFYCGFTKYLRVQGCAAGMHHVYTRQWWSGGSPPPDVQCGTGKKSDGKQPGTCTNCPGGQYQVGGLGRIFEPWRLPKLPALHNARWSVVVSTECSSPTPSHAHTTPFPQRKHMGQADDAPLDPARTRPERQQPPNHHL